MNKHISHLLLLSCAIVLMSGCTLEPHMYHGEDILDDTPTKPVPHATFIDDYESKSSPSAPLVKESPKAKIAEAPKAVVKPLEKTAEKPVEKIVEKTAVVKETVVTKEAIKEMPKEVTKTVVKSESSSKPCTTDVAPPMAPSAGGLQTQLSRHTDFKKGERIKVTVYREKDLSGTYEVSDKGTINFPLLGQVKAEGLTSSQLEENLTKGLSAGYLVKPEVSVEYLPDCAVK